MNLDQQSNDRAVARDKAVNDREVAIEQRDYIRDQINAKHEEEVETTNSVLLQRVLTNLELLDVKVTSIDKKVTSLTTTVVGGDSCTDTGIKGEVSTLKSKVNLLYWVGGAVTLVVIGLLVNAVLKGRVL